MLLASAHKKCLAQKVGHLGSLGWIPIIQISFESSCVALQYKTGIKFSHRAVPELHAVKNSAKIVISPCTFTYKPMILTVQAILAIKGHLEVLLKVVGAFTISLLFHLHSYG